jgi:hypothetical protein
MLIFLFFIVHRVVDEISQNEISQNEISCFVKFLCLFREISYSKIYKILQYFAKFREIFATKFRFLLDKAKKMMRRRSRK